MPKGRLRGKSVFEIGKEIKRADESGKVHKNSPSIVDGLTPEPFPMTEGYQVLSPEQIASLKVPQLDIEDKKIHGFQRDVKRPHIRRIARSMEDGRPMEQITVALYKGTAYIVNGQQRSFAALIARQPLPAVLRKLDAEEQHQIFSDQRKAMKVDRSLLVLTADDPFSEYIQDAVTSHTHPWSDLVATSNNSKSKMNPFQAHDAISRYVASAVTSHVQRRLEQIPFEEDKAEELARLFKCFGNKADNPLAFKPVAIKAIVYAAIVIIRRSGSKPKDITRWIEWMPHFDFGSYRGISRGNELAFHLLLHWNKRLKADNRVPVPSELM